MPPPDAPDPRSPTATSPPRSPDAPQRALDDGAAPPPAPPAALAALLFPGEQVLWWARPVRPASGNARFAVAAIGALFLPASIGAAVDVAAREGPLAAKVALLAGCVVFVAFSAFAAAFPLVAARRMRRTVAAVTTLRVVEIVEGGRARTWPVEDVGDATIGRRRGASASLILKERLRERATDGRVVYEHEAVHGLPDADAALNAIAEARSRRRT